MRGKSKVANDPAGRGSAAWPVSGIGPSAPFASNDEALEAARRMFRARGDLKNMEADFSADPARLEAMRVEAAERTNHWHRSLVLSPPEQVFAGRCLKHRFNRIEREILAALVLEKLALVEERVSRFGEMIEFLHLPDRRVMTVLRAMSGEGRLFRAGLIDYEDPDEDIRDRRLVVDPALVEEVLIGRGARTTGWPVKTEGELFDHLATLTRLMSKQNHEVGFLLRGHGSQADVFKTARLIDRQLRDFQRTVGLHPDWKIAGVAGDFKDLGWLRREMLIILLALLGKELGHLDADDDLFQGGGLVRAATRKSEHVRSLFCLLDRDGPMVRDGLIQPCGGPDSHVEEGPDGLQEVEFELTGATWNALGLEKQGTRKRKNDSMIRQPLVSLDQLVLGPEIRRALGMALTHAARARTLDEDWGLGKTIPYGRSVTLLFSGPPGVGKTACAEAIAGELERPILAVDYSQVQNCFVGVTEKNIVRLFKEARTHNAVLFWDEADAMFYDRDSAMRNWEVRDVNVLLQELERFEGVCVLATNRKVSLDPALERRITLKVGFEPPNREERLAIWQRMIPAKMPLADDVDLDRLSLAELTGGEIKNVLLNASRLALSRNGQGPVTMNDFTVAVRMEQDGAWKGGGAKSGIGFRLGEA
jgi:hypothetical protein